MKPVLVLCLGNEVLSDDAFGPTVAKLLETDGPMRERADVIFAPVAGFHLLDLLQGREKVLVVDSIVTGSARPGTLHFFPMGQLAPSKGLTTSHQLNLPTALSLGSKMGYRMPQHIDVLAVEIADNTTISEQLTAEVSAAVEPALSSIANWTATHVTEVTV